MPHVVIEVAAHSATGDQGATPLTVPGLTPGEGIRNLRAQRRQKPIIILNNAWASIKDFSTTAASDMNYTDIWLKLSTASDLSPGLLLPLKTMFANTTVTANVLAAYGEIDEAESLRGTSWAFTHVGARTDTLGARVQNLAYDIHIDYEVALVDWSQWFLMWEYMDGITDNEKGWYQ